MEALRKQLHNKYVICNTEKEWIQVLLVVANIYEKPTLFEGMRDAFEKLGPMYLRFREGGYGFDMIKNIDKFCVGHKQIPIEDFLKSY